jgi:hypothetical protein
MIASSAWSNSFASCGLGLVQYASATRRYVVKSVRCWRVMVLTFREVSSAYLFGTDARGMGVSTMLVVDSYEDVAIVQAGDNILVKDDSMFGNERLGCLVMYGHAG